jgi:hypothetical protein
MRGKSSPGLLVIIGLLGILPALANIKAGGLQAEDLLLLLLMGFCVARFLCSGFSFHISSQLSHLIRSYGLLLAMLLLLAFFALRLTFYPLDEVSLLKQPVIFSLSKLLQLAAIVCSFFWLTNRFLSNGSLLARAMTIYWRTGLVISWYAIASYVLLAATHLSVSSATLVPGAYGADSELRARGFFNEGGPFGIYLVSVFTIGVLRRYMTGRSLGAINCAALSIAFLISGSKAGFFVAALLLLYSVMSAASFRKKAAYLVLSTIILCGAAVWLNLGTLLSAYAEGYKNVEDKVALLGRDPNVVMGRIAALYIVPRMISAHPVTGIGIGNYPLMRNDPRYLGSLPTITDVEDLPAIGIPAIAAEMGIPAALWLVVLLFAPYRASRKKASVIAVAALFQPFAHALGVQLTFAYPWFVSACALAASFREPEKFCAPCGNSPHSKSIFFLGSFRSCWCGTHFRWIRRWVAFQ